MPKDDSVYVGHMLDTARLAAAKVAGISREAFEADENLRLALTHLVQTIGEAAGKSRPVAAKRIHKSRGPRLLECVTAWFTITFMWTTTSSGAS